MIQVFPNTDATVRIQLANHSAVINTNTAAAWASWLLGAALDASPVDLAHLGLSARLTPAECVVASGLIWQAACDAVLLAGLPDCQRAPTKQAVGGDGAAQSREIVCRHGKYRYSPLEDRDV